MSKYHKKFVSDFSDFFSEINDPQDQAIYQVQAREYDVNYTELVEHLAQDAQILELGCGFGFLCRWLVANGFTNLSGVDLCQGQLDVAVRFLPESVKLKNQDATSFVNEHPETYDLIFAIDILEHLPTKDELMELVDGIFAALKPGGVFIARLPNMANILGPYLLYKDFTHYHGFTSESLIQILHVAGFSEPGIMRLNPSDLSQRARLILENLMHRIIFRITGRGAERHFQKFLVCRGTKPKK